MGRVTGGIVFCLCLFMASSLQAGQTREIAGVQALATALAEATPGDTLVLAPGDYGRLELIRTGGDEGAPITLRSADPAHMARFDRMVLRDVENLILDRVMLDYQFTPNDVIYLRPFEVIGSRDVTLRHVLLDGDKAKGVSAIDDGHGYAIGLGVVRTTGLTIEDSEVRGFHRGLVISQSREVAVLRNEVHSVRSDAMNFAEVAGLRIEENFIHGFDLAYGSDDHADMIQIWTNGTESPSTGISIRNNVLNSAGMGWTQSIFMRNDMVDRGLAGDEMFYRNVEITGNVIINAHLHGITVGETHDLVITKNTIVQDIDSRGKPPEDPLWMPRIFVSPQATNVRIEGNAVDSIHGYEAQRDWVVQRNILIQNVSRSRPGFYGLVFTNFLDGEPSSLAAFSSRPGGPLAATGIGAPRLDAKSPLPAGPQH